MGRGSLNRHTMFSSARKGMNKEINVKMVS